MKKGRIDTKVDPIIKTQWDNFMIQKHGTIKGPYGKELDLAMLNHMKKFTIIKSDNKIKMTKTTLESLKSLSAGCDMLPSTKIKPIVLTSLIKKYTGLTDMRSINKYRSIVMDNSKMITVDDEPFPLLDVEGFCTYVQKLTHENF